MDNLEHSNHKQRLQMVMLLCFLVYFVGFSFISRQYPAVQPTPESLEAAEPSSADGQLSSEITNAEPKQNISKQVNVAPTVEKLPRKDIDISNDQSTANVRSDTGSISNIILNEYTELPALTSIWGWLFGGASDSFEPYTGGDSPLSILSESGSMLVVGDNSGVIPAEGYRMSSRDEFIVASGNSNGINVEKKFKKLDELYQYQVDISITNNSSSSVDDLWLGVSEEMTGAAGRFSNDVRPQFYVDEELYGTFGTMFSTDFLDLEDMVENPTRVNSEPVWFGVGSRYFMVAANATQKDVFSSVQTHQFSDENYGAIAQLKQSIDAGATRNITMRIYAGPRQLDLLEQLGEEWSISVEYGMFGFFSRVLLFMLKVIQAGFVNWGVSILLLTLIIKVIFFPLTQKAFVSAKKMSALQPQLKELRETYKDNQQLQAQETMKLFQKHSVSPLGGCLPTLIQIPVWFALYNVMLYSVELYDSSFLYLQDLTSMDPYGILPVLYCVLMFTQQRMMPMANMDPTQQRLMKLMPLMFGAFMFTFPSGLVLYFSMNILLTIFQQWLIRVQFDEKSVEVAS